MWLPHVNPKEFKELIGLSTYNMQMYYPNSNVIVGVWNYLLTNSSFAKNGKSAHVLVSASDESTVLGDVICYRLMENDSASSRWMLVHLAVVSEVTGVKNSYENIKTSNQELE